MTEQPALADELARLRRFGRSFALLIVVFFGLLLPWLFSYPLPYWPWVLALPVWLLAELSPRHLVHVEIAWLKLGELIGRVISPVLLAVVYVLLITPLGWLKRRVGQSRIRIRLDPAAESYLEPPSRTTRHEDPF